MDYNEFNKKFNEETAKIFFFVSLGSFLLFVIGTIIYRLF